MIAEMIEDYDWESDESEDWESDEAFAESDESAEDIGERARRRRASGRRPSRTVRPFKPVGGVQGMAVRDPSGGVRKVAFPAKLARASDTNRGLANQELARRDLAARVSDIESKRRKDLRNAGQATGLASILMIGGLSGFAASKAVQVTSGSKFQDWVNRTPTQMATAAAATHLVGSGASYLFTGGYHGGPIRITADAVAAAQLALFAFGSLNTPPPPPPPPRAFGDKRLADADAKATLAPEGTLYLAINTNRMFRVVYDQNKIPQLTLVS